MKQYINLHLLPVYQKKIVYGKKIFHGQLIKNYNYQEEFVQ